MQGGTPESAHEMMLPYAGIIRIRFNGYDLSPGGHPCKYIIQIPDQVGNDVIAGLTGYLFSTIRIS